VSVDEKNTFVASMATTYGRRIRRFLAARLRNASDVPDLAQEVFLRLLRVGSPETIRAPEAYLITIASHVIHQYMLRQASLPEALEEPETPMDPDSLRDMDAVEQLDAQRALGRLERLLEELPPNVRACFVLQRVYGYSLDEIVAEVGIARSTVKKYLVRAIAHCQQVQESE
jgi:RNA polymerase sigma-70 factor (ECF subfamily)